MIDGVVGWVLSTNYTDSVRLDRSKLVSFDTVEEAVPFITDEAMETNTWIKASTVISVPHGANVTNLIALGASNLQGIETPHVDTVQLSLVKVA